VKNYYEILGIDTNADEQEIKKAYLTQVKKFHPDSPLSKENPEAKKNFELIKESYDTLSNKDLRRSYDKYVLKKLLRKKQQKSPAEEDRGNKFYEQGRYMYRAGRYQSASVAFQTALNLEPDNALFCSWLGLTFSHLPGQLRDAKEWCEKAIKLSPHNPDYYINLAIIYKDAGIETKAKTFLQKAVAIDPDNKRANTWLKENSEGLSVKGLYKDIIRKLKKR
jgi:tetratricopeptide (TPR) repeat protein